MLVAAFITHANDGIFKQEKALLYILVYIMIILTGSGRFSVDNLLKGRKYSMKLKTENWLLLLGILITVFGIITKKFLFLLLFLPLGLLFSKDKDN